MLCPWSQYYVILTSFRIVLCFNFTYCIQWPRLSKQFSPSNSTTTKHLYLYNKRVNYGSWMQSLLLPLLLSILDASAEDRQGCINLKKRSFPRWITGEDRRRDVDENLCHFYVYIYISPLKKKKCVQWISIVFILNYWKYFHFVYLQLLDAKRAESITATFCDSSHLLKGSINHVINRDVTLFML